jgi:hypothetical protein
MAHTNITDTLRFPEESKLDRNLFIVGGATLLLSLSTLFTDSDAFFFSWITSFSFLSSFFLGSLFFVLIQHITRSKWSVTVRRIPESFIANFWKWGLFFLPIIIAMASGYLTHVYHWTDAKYVVDDPILSGKVPFLNEPFFIARQVIYFMFWSYIGWKLHKTSVEMDKTGDWGLQTLLRKVSAPGLFIGGFIIAFAAFDWLMSIDAHWFSTMFGVYYFAMSFQVSLAAMALIVFWLHGKGLLKNVVNKAHYNDIGYLLFGFTVFYAYIAFCQYLLIYYANIPEETLFFYHRMEGNWEYLTYSLLIFRFVVPFLLLLSKPAKASKSTLKLASWIIIVMHFIEISWIIKPVQSHHGFELAWVDLTVLIGLSCIMLGLFVNTFRKNDMIPSNDPHLEECLHKH